MRNEQGFTLVEVLVALVIGSMLLAALSWVVAGLGRDLRAPEKHQQRRQLEDIAPSLKSLLEGLVPSSTNDDLVFISDHLNAMVAPPQALASAGPLRLDLRVERMRGGEALTIAFKVPDASPTFPAKLLERRILAEGFKRIAMTALDTDTSATSTLPRAIKIAFVDQSGESMSIIVEPRISSNGACRFDPISMACRT